MYIYLNWSIITLQCCAGFWCTVKWIRCKYTYNPSLLHLPPTPPSQPSRSSQSTELSSPCYAAASLSLSILHMVMPACQSHSLNPSHLPLPQPLCPSVHPLCLPLCSRPANRFHLYHFLNSILCINTWYLFFSFWDTSFCMMGSRSIHTSTNDPAFFLSMAE